MHLQLNCCCDTSSLVKSRTNTHTQTNTNRFLRPYARGSGRPRLAYYLHLMHLSMKTFRHNSEIGVGGWGGGVGWSLASSSTAAASVPLPFTPRLISKRPLKLNITQHASDSPHFTVLAGNLRVSKEKKGGGGLWRV